jgi:hypothetical protein
MGEGPLMSRPVQCLRLWRAVCSCGRAVRSGSQEGMCAWADQHEATAPGVHVVLRGE